MTIGIILSLIGGGVGLIAILVIVAKLKRAKKDREENKTLKKYGKKIVKTERQKNNIRKKHSEKANDIISNPNGSNNVLPVVSREHNHAFRDQCTEDCPAYNKQ